MNRDLIKFLMPAEFVVARVILTPGELAYGYLQGWLADADAVSVAVAGLGLVTQAPPSYEELALLLSDDYGRIPALISDLWEHSDSHDDCAGVWLFLALNWVFDHRAMHSDPLAIVEQLYADFDYPDAIEGFVRFMPARQGDSVGESALYDRWKVYLDNSREIFSTRSLARNAESSPCARRSSRGSKGACWQDLRCCGHFGRLCTCRAKAERTHGRPVVEFRPFLPRLLLGR